jgi:hypothetical protein
MERTKFHTAAASAAAGLVSSGWRQRPKRAAPCSGRIATLAASRHGQEYVHCTSLEDGVQNRAIHQKLDIKIVRNRLPASSSSKNRCLSSYVTVLNVHTFILYAVRTQLDNIKLSSLCHPARHLAPAAIIEPPPPRLAPTAAWNPASSAFPSPQASVAASEQCSARQPARSWTRSRNNGHAKKPPGQRPAAAHHLLGGRGGRLQDGETAGGRGGGLAAATSSFRLCAPDRPFTTHAPLSSLLAPPRLTISPYAGSAWTAQGPTGRSFTRAAARAGVTRRASRVGSCSRRGPGAQTERSAPLGALWVAQRWLHAIDAPSATTCGRVVAASWPRLHVLFSKPSSVDGAFDILRSRPALAARRRNRATPLAPTNPRRPRPTLTAGARPTATFAARTSRTGRTSSPPTATPPAPPP